MNKRYQVFVSSTYEDLRAERQEVMQALLELDCIPSGMELFPAADEDQWSLIKRVISDCDYYIVIIGGRYGSIGPGGKSYTQMEYEYALEIGKPTIAFMHKDPSTIPAGKSEKTDEGRKGLREFREMVEQKLVKHWASPAELGSVVSRSLIKLIKQKPGVGWVRADEVPDEKATKELLRLKEKVEELESELQQVSAEGPSGIEDLAQGDDEFTIQYQLRFYKQGEGFAKPDVEVTHTWNEIFARLAPLMMNEAPEARLRNGLVQIVLDDHKDEVKRLAGDSNVEATVRDDDFQSIKIQFRALGLITKSEKARSVKDTQTYWALTPYGDTVMTRLRAIRRGQS